MPPSLSVAGHILSHTENTDTNKGTDIEQKALTFGQVNYVLRYFNKWQFMLKLHVSLL